MVMDVTYQGQTLSEKDHGCAHWVDGKFTETVGTSGALIRFRSLLSASAFTLLLAGTPFWVAFLPKKWLNGIGGSWAHSINLSFTVKGAAFTSGLIIITLTSLLFYYVRKRTRRSLTMKALLHSLSHDSRDHFDKTISYARNSRGADDFLPREKVDIAHFSDKACNTIADYFSILTGDPSVSCALRVVQPDGAYHTVGRSGNLSSGRERSTEAISAEIGAPRFFRDLPQGPQGVLFIYDKNKASACGIFKKTHNCINFPSETKYLAIAPVSGWSADRRELIGLLIVSSNSKKILNPVHTDLYRCSADQVALTMSAKFATLYFMKRIQDLQQQYPLDKAAERDI